MNPHFQYKRRFENIFLLDVPKFQKVVTILNESFSKKQIVPYVSIEIVYSNGKKATHNSIESVISEDNSIKTPINSLIVAYRDSQESPKWLVEIEYDRIYPDIFLRTLGADKEWASNTFSDIEDQIERIISDDWLLKTVKSRFFFIYFSCLLIAMAPFATIISSPAVKLSMEEIQNFISNSEQISSDSGKIDFLFQIKRKEMLNSNDPINFFSKRVRLSFKTCFIILPFFLIAFYFLYLSKFYPSSLFLWGDHIGYFEGKKAQREKFSNWVFSCFIIGVLANLYVFFVTK